MVTFVFLDLDDTLLDFHWAEDRAIAQTLTQLGLSASPENRALYSQINQSCWKGLERGELTRAQLLTGRFAQLFRQLGVRRDPEEAQALYGACLAQGHRFLPGAEALLEALQGKYRLFLASNGNTRTQLGRLASAGISPYFEQIFLSEELGAQKPSPAFFQACFDRIDGFDPAQGVLVGDSLTSDILGGRNAGLRTVWYNPKGLVPGPEIFPDYTVSALEEIPSLLADIQRNSSQHPAAGSTACDD